MYLNKEELPTLDLIEQMKEFFGDVTKHKITGAIILGGGFIKH
jgi:deoxyhypusine synthase